MKKRLVLFVSMFLLGGCSTEEKRVLERLKPEEEDTFSVQVYLKESPSEEYQRSILDIYDNHSLWGEKITVHGFTILGTDVTSDVDYKAILDIDHLPEIFVLNHEGIVFRTYDVKELEEFLLSQ